MRDRFQGSLAVLRLANHDRATSYRTCLIKCHSALWLTRIVILITQQQKEPRAKHTREFDSKERESLHEPPDRQTGSTGRTRARLTSTYNPVEKINLSLGCMRFHDCPVQQGEAVQEASRVAQRTLGPLPAKAAPRPKINQVRSNPLGFLPTICSSRNILSASRTCLSRIRGKRSRRHLAERKEGPNKLFDHNSTQRSRLRCPK